MHDLYKPEVLYNELNCQHKEISSFYGHYHDPEGIRDCKGSPQGSEEKSGEPYIIHPLCVAIILADLELDKETIVAGLLHDAVEDTWMTCDEITREFGPEVALLVGWGN